jgi:methylenetetrahydrofolate reductase (NADPH)
MQIGEIYRELPFGLSIEVFPPKTPAGDDALFETLSRAARWNPAFISCTYGAGGTTSKRTIELCAAIQNDVGLTATAHFTCVNSTQDQLVQWLDEACSRGIGNIMALRGDPPSGETEFVEVDGGFRHASELVSLIRERFPNMGIGVAGYPEKHPEAADGATDLAHLKRKVDCGADAVFTQLFYENTHFLRFRDQYDQAGIDRPLIPGIMPITEFTRIKRIISLCGAAFPEQLAARLEAAQDDKSAQFEIGVEHAIAQCQELVDQGVPGIHFYVLNRMDACDRILDAINLPAGVGGIGNQPA